LTGGPESEVMRMAKKKNKKGKKKNKR